MQKSRNQKKKETKNFNETFLGTYFENKNKKEPLPIITQSATNSTGDTGNLDDTNNNQTIESLFIDSKNEIINEEILIIDSKNDINNDKTPATNKKNEEISLELKQEMVDDANGQIAKKNKPTTTNTFFAKIFGYFSSSKTDNTNVKTTSSNPSQLETIKNSNNTGTMHDADSIDIELEGLNELWGAVGTKNANNTQTPINTNNIPNTNNTSNKGTKKNIKSRVYASVYNGTKNYLKGSYNGATSYVSGSYNRAKNYLNESYNTAKSYVSGSYNGATSYISGSYNKASDQVSRFYRNIAGSVTEYFWSTKKVNETINKTVVNSQDMENQVKSVVSDSVDEVNKASFIEVLLPEAVPVINQLKQSILGHTENTDNTSSQNQSTVLHSLFERLKDNGNSLASEQMVLATQFLESFVKIVKELQEGKKQYATFIAEVNGFTKVIHLNLTDLLNPLSLNKVFSAFLREGAANPESNSLHFNMILTSTEEAAVVSYVTKVLDVKSLVHGAQACLSVKETGPVLSKSLSEILSTIPFANVDIMAKIVKMTKPEAAEGLLKFHTALKTHLNNATQHHYSPEQIDILLNRIAAVSLIGSKIDSAIEGDSSAINDFVHRNDFSNQDTLKTILVDSTLENHPEISSFMLGHVPSDMPLMDNLEEESTSDLESSGVIPKGSNDKIENKNTSDIKDKEDIKDKKSDNTENKNKKNVVNKNKDNVDSKNKDNVDNKNKDNADNKNKDNVDDKNKDNADNKNKDKKEEHKVLDLTQHKNKFKECLDALAIISNRLLQKRVLNKNYINVADKALNLHVELDKAANKFFAAPTTESLKEFKQTCEDTIKKAKLDFGQHREIWYAMAPILRTLLGILATLTIIPAVVAVAAVSFAEKDPANKKSYIDIYTNLFFITPKPNSAQQCEKVETKIAEAQTEIEQAILSV